MSFLDKKPINSSGVVFIMKISTVKFLCTGLLLVGLLFASFDTTAVVDHFQDKSSGVSTVVPEYPVPSSNSFRVIMFYGTIDHNILSSMEEFYPTVEDVLPVEMVQVSSAKQLAQALLELNENDMATYFFHGLTTGLVLDDGLLAWKDLEVMILLNEARFHYFTSCHSYTIDQSDGYHTIVGQKGEVDYRVAAVTVSMTLGATLEQFNVEKSRTIVNRAARIIEADNFDFMERILNPTQTMTAVHFKSNALRTVEEFFGQIEEFFKDADKNPTIKLVMTLLGLMAGEVDLTTPLSSYGGVGGSTDSMVGNETHNRKTGLSFWVGRTINTYHSAEDGVAYDIFADVLQVKLIASIEIQREMAVGPVPVDVTFGIEGELVIEFLLEYYGSDPNNINNPSALWESNTSSINDIDELMAYAHITGFFGEEYYIEAPFGSINMNIPVTFRVYGNLVGFVKGEIGINLSKRWKNLPNLTLPLELGGKANTVFALGGSGLNVNIDAELYAEVAKDASFGIGIGTVSFDLLLRVDLPFRSGFVWDDIGFNLNDAYAYFPVLSAKAEVTFEDSIPFVDIGFSYELFENILGRSIDGTNSNNYFYVGSDDGTKRPGASDDLGNYMVEIQLDVALNYPIDNIIKFPQMTGDLAKLLGGTGETIPGSAFDRTPPKIKLITKPQEFEPWWECDFYLKWGWFPSLACESWTLPLHGDDEVFTLKTIDEHDNYNTNSVVKHVAVAIDRKPNYDLYRDVLSYSIENTGTHYPGGHTGARMVRYLLNLNLNDIQSYVEFKGMDGYSYGKFTPLSALTSNNHARYTQDFVNAVKGYQDFAHLWQPYEYKYSQLAELPSWLLSLISGFGLFGDIEGDLEATASALSTGDIYLWSPWMRGEEAKIYANLIGGDTAQVMAVEYFDTIQWTSEQTADDEQGYIRKYNEVLGDNDTDYSAYWDVYMDLYAAKTYSSLKNGWHDIYVVAIDSAGLESMLVERFYIENPDDNTVPLLSSVNGFETYSGSSPSGSMVVEGSYTIQFDAQDYDQILVYNVQYGSTPQRTYHIASGIDLNTGVNLDIMDYNGASVLNRSMSLASSGSWYRYVATIDFSEWDNGDYVLTATVLDNLGQVTSHSYWLTVANPSMERFIEFGGMTWSKEIRNRGTSCGTDYYESEKNKVAWDALGGDLDVLEGSSTYLRYVGVSYEFTATANSYKLSLDAKVTAGHASPQSSGFYVAIYDAYWNSAGVAQQVTISTTFHTNEFAFAGLAPGMTYHLLLFYSDSWSWDWNQHFWIKNVNFSAENNRHLVLDDRTFTKEIRTRGDNPQDMYGSDYYKGQWTSGSYLKAHEYYSTYLRYVGFSYAFTARSSSVTVNLDGRYTDSYYNTLSGLYVGVYDSNWVRVGSNIRVTPAEDWITGWSSTYSGLVLGQTYHVFMFYSDSWSTDWQQTIYVQNFSYST